jgi:hypothetical protein
VGSAKIDELAQLRRQGLRGTCAKSTRTSDKR